MIIRKCILCFTKVKFDFKKQSRKGVFNFEEPGQNLVIMF